MKRVIFLALALTACNTPRPEPGIKVVTQTVVKETMRPCAVSIPKRPAPLPRPLPTDAVALAAVLAERLVEYASPGGFADKAIAALEVCAKP